MYHWIAIKLDNRKAIMTSKFEMKIKYHISQGLNLLKAFRMYELV